jgi:hypothetical protein
LRLGLKSPDIYIILIGKRLGRGQVSRV